MNVVKEVQRINDLELEKGIPFEASWHQEYKSSSYVYVGGLDDRLTEGDVIAVMSQFGEIVHCDYSRDPKTGKPRGFAFVAYEDQRSTVLAVDNLTGFKLLGKTIRVDHKLDYKNKIKEAEEVDPLRLPPGHWAVGLKQTDLEEEEKKVKKQKKKGAVSSF